MHGVLRSLRAKRGSRLGTTLEAAGCAFSVRRIPVIRQVPLLKGKEGGHPIVICPSRATAHPLTFCDRHLPQNRVCTTNTGYLLRTYNEHPGTYHRDAPHSPVPTCWSASFAANARDRASLYLILFYFIFFALLVAVITHRLCPTAGQCIVPTISGAQDTRFLFARQKAVPTSAWFRMYNAS